MRTLTSVRALALAMVFGALLHQSARAQTNNWTNAANANWSVASAWSAGVPTSLQDVYHTNTATTITVNTNASVKTLTIGGASGTALFNMTTANVTLTTGGDITLAPGASNATFQLANSNITVSINGGAGSIINGGGAGTASLNVQSGFSNSLGLLNASVDDLNMAQGGTVTLVITNGQTYTVANLLRLNNATAVAGSTGTILMNGGTLNVSGTEIRFNSGTNTANQSYLILNSNAVVTASTIQRYYLGTDAAIHWNDGTIGNYAGTNLTIDARGTTNGTMNVKLAGTGVHTFDASSTNTITVAATAQLQDKTGEAGTLVKAGTGVLILAGSNSYTGGTTLNAGTLSLSNNSALGTGALTINGGSVGSAGGTRTLANNLVLNTNLTVNAGGAFSVSGNVDLAGSTRVINQNGVNATYSGVISNGGLTISNSGSGIDTFLSGANTYSGATTVRLGILNLSGSGSLSNSAVNLTGGAASTLSIAGVTASTEIGSLAGNASSKVDLGASKTLTVGRDNTSTTFAGVMSNTGSLIKTGSGTMILSGVNTYSGTTTVSAGSLDLATNGSLRFVVGGSGTNNSLTGAGAALLNGGFSIDLTSASTNANDSWTIVQPTLSTTYGATFSVSGFTGSGGVWTNSTNGVNYIFTQSSGILAVVNTNAVGNYSSWVSYWQGIDPNFTNTAPGANPDGDPFDNNMEFAFDGDPMVGTGALLTSAMSGTNSVFNYVERRNPPGGVTYQVQFTGNLTSGWTNSSVPVFDSSNQSGISQTNNYVRREFVVPAVGSGFYRVRATIAP